MSTKLSVLICHLKEREAYLSRLLDVLRPQQAKHPFSIITDSSKNLSIGAKRNRLLEGVTTEYLCFCDDDDIVSPNYIELLMEGINNGVDCCSLLGQITFDGKNPELFEHSIKYKAYRTIEGAKIKYQRYPNHLNCIKSSIAKQFRFPEKNHGEDTDWATQIYKSGLLKTEHYIPEILYYYEYRSKK